MSKPKISENLGNEILPEISTEKAALPSFPSVPAGAQIRGVGIDLESVERLKIAAERGGDAVLEKVFSREEIALCRSRGAHVWESFAARWAAKEAFSNAVGTGIGGEISLSEFEVLSENSGAPFAKISVRGNAALAKISAKNAFVSLTHTKEFAAAIVVLAA